ncbi:hypothetical protein [Amaricoccus sp.]|uniref:hypothetical protein n=1 Tax=Amaricoccus sp. TaxID=1872485 RepID=UPI0026345463|nr:hypothetical protein [Amaricoccus sp.]HRO11129.1 hypothetical protein [Amaricoccus sp.]
MPADTDLPRRTPLRDAIAEALFTTAGADAAVELRALVAARETRAERLFARYRGRPSRALRRGRWTDGIPGAIW